MSQIIVVDASVAIKWFLPEIHCESASLLLKKKCELSAPDLIWVEVGNVLWKKVVRKELSPQESEGLLKDFIRFPIQTHSSKILLNTAWQLASRSGATVYDCLYLALASYYRCSLVTADRKFYEAVTKKIEGSRVVWVEDI